MSSNAFDDFDEEFPVPTKSAGKNAFDMFDDDDAFNEPESFERFEASPSAWPSKSITPPSQKKVAPPPNLLKNRPAPPPPSAPPAKDRPAPAPPSAGGSRKPLPPPREPAGFVPRYTSVLDESDEDDEPIEVTGNARRRSVPAAPPAPPDDDDDLDSDDAGPPPGPPPKKSNAAAAYDEYSDDDDNAPPPPGPPPQGYAASDEEDVAPPPGSPPEVERDEYDDYEETGEDNIDPPPNPPEDEFEYADDEQHWDEPPPGPPPYDDEEEEHYETPPPPPPPPPPSSQQARAQPPPAKPLPPPGPPPPTLKSRQQEVLPEEDDDYTDDDDDDQEYDEKEVAPPPPPRGPRVLPPEEFEEDVDEIPEDSTPPPPPPPPHDYVLPGEESEDEDVSDTNSPPPPPSHNIHFASDDEEVFEEESPPGQARQPPPLPPPPSQQRESDDEQTFEQQTSSRAVPIPDVHQQAVIVLPPPEPERPRAVENVEDVAPESEERTMVRSASQREMLEKKAFQERIAQEVLGKGSQTSINRGNGSIEPPVSQNTVHSSGSGSYVVSNVAGDDDVEIRPPSHPPPPSYPLSQPPPPSHPPPDQIRRASTTSLLAPSEERQVALRLLRAIDSNTRILNNRLISSALDVYEASDVRGTDQVSFVELAAAVKMLDPELSVDQAMRFVSGLAVQAKIRADRDYFASSAEFETALSAVAGVDLALLNTSNGQEEASVLSQGQVSEGRTLEQYVTWINSLDIWPPIADLVETLKSGVLLCRLVEHLILSSTGDMGFKLRGVNTKPRSRAPCMQNIELALSQVWKQRVAARNMPSAERVYNGDPVAVKNLMREMFTAMALPALDKRDMFDWFDGVLKHYPQQKEIAQHVRQPPHRGLWAAFGGGDAIACILHFFCGPEGSEALRLPAVDLGRFYANPARSKEALHNAQELFELLPMSGIPVPWRLEEFVRAEDHEMLLLQLANIYIRFKDAVCALPLVVPGGALPPQSSTKQYVAVGHDGEARIVGVSFRDHFAPASPETGNEEDGEVAAKQAATAAAPGKRAFTGYHAFSSDDHLDVVESKEGGEVSSEVFFLSSPGLTVPPPPVVSETLARSSLVSLERALTRTSNSDVDASFNSTFPRTAHTMVRRASSSSSAGLPQSADAVAEIRARMRQRMASMTSAVSPLAHMQERAAMELEDQRRKAFVRGQQQPAAIRERKTPIERSSRRDVDDDEDKAERIRAALLWLQTPRDVMMHNRNSYDSCRLSLARMNTGDYVLQWVNNEAEEGSVFLSEVSEITTIVQGRSHIVVVKLGPTHALKTSKGRPALHIEPVRQQDSLRLFTSLTVLFEDTKARQRGLEGRTIVSSSAARGGSRQEEY